LPYCICNKEKKGKIITKNVVLENEEKLKINKRAKSAKLRVFEKI